MKKVLIGFVFVFALVTISSCKKEYTCTCYIGQGNVDWTGTVTATSKAAAVSSVKSDCTAGDQVTCN